MVTRMLSRMVAGGREADSGVGATGTDGTGAAFVVAPGIDPLRDGVAGFTVAAGEVTEFCGATAGVIGRAGLMPTVAEEFVSAVLFVGRAGLKSRYNPIPTRAQTSATTGSHFFIRSQDWARRNVRCSGTRWRGCRCPR